MTCLGRIRKLYMRLSGGKSLTWSLIITRCSQHGTPPCIILLSHCFSSTIGWGATSNKKVLVRKRVIYEDFLAIFTRQTFVIINSWHFFVPYQDKWILIEKKEKNSIKIFFGVFGSTKTKSCEIPLSWNSFRGSQIGNFPLQSLPR